MPTDIYDSEPRHGEAGRRPAPRCYRRSDAVAASRSNAETTAHAFALGLLLSIVSCIAVFLLVQGGWSLR